MQTNRSSRFSVSRKPKSFYISEFIFMAIVIAAGAVYILDKFG